MLEKKDTSYFDDKMQEIQKRSLIFFNVKKELKPINEALKIIIIYLLIGAVWILLSDKILNLLIKDIELFKKIQLYKGWLYVFITGIIFYFIISKKMMLFKDATDRIYEGYEELSATHEELVAMEEELNQQYEDLEKHRDALLMSDQRYKLAVEGSNDGIWDWDMENDTYFFSVKLKSVFGYSEDDLTNTLESFKKLIHQDDLENLTKSMENYMAYGQGMYEATYRLRCKEGGYRWILSRGKGVWNDNGKPIRMAGSHTDITERMKMEENLHLLAYYDGLTKLPNRSMFEKEISRLIDQSKLEDIKMAVIYINIDNFKHINDTLGHFVGDKLLCYISNILSYHIKAPNMVARLSGDEFGVLLTKVEENDYINGVVNTILKFLRRPWILEKQEFFISVSIGVAMYPDHGKDIVDLMQNADIAMFHVKENGKDGYCVYNQDMREKAWKYIQMNSQLIYAIKNGEFLLYYQPQIDLKTNKIIGVEALIRWLHPQKGFIPPMEFIPFAEETGHIHKISEWVLKTACEQNNIWQEKGYNNIKIAVNLSGKLLAQKTLVRDIQNTLETYGVKASEIELEITETAIIVDLENSVEVLQNLKAFGVSISLDDFGTGYSSLTYLQKLPIDILKMDREFIKNIVDESEEGFIFKTVVELAHNLGLKVVAEGVETIEQLEFLRKNGCDIAQGYYFSKPIPASELEELLRLNH